MRCKRRWRNSLCLHFLRMPYLSFWVRDISCKSHVQTSLAFTIHLHVSVIFTSIHKSSHLVATFLLAYQKFLTGYIPLIETEHLWWWDFQRSKENSMQILWIGSPYWSIWTDWLKYLLRGVAHQTSFLIKSAVSKGKIRRGSLAFFSFPLFQFSLVPSPNKKS